MFCISGGFPLTRVPGPDSHAHGGGQSDFLVAFLLFIVRQVLKAFSVQHWMDPQGPLRQKVQNKETEEVTHTENCSTEKKSQVVRGLYMSQVGGSMFMLELPKTNFQQGPLGT